MALVTSTVTDTTITNSGTNGFGYTDSFTQNKKVVSVVVDLQTDSFGTPDLVTITPQHSGLVGNVYWNAYTQPISQSLDELLKSDVYLRRGLGSIITPSDGTVINTDNTSFSVDYSDSMTASAAGYNLSYSINKYELTVTMIGCGRNFSGNQFYYCIEIPSSVQSDISRFFSETPTHISFALNPTTSDFAIGSFLKLPDAVPTNFVMHADSSKGLYLSQYNFPVPGQIIFLGTDILITLYACVYYIFGAGPYTNGLGPNNVGLATSIPTIRWSRLCLGYSAPSVRANVKWWYPDRTFTIDSQTLSGSSVGFTDPSNTSEYYVTEASFTPTVIPPGAIYYNCYFDNVSISTTQMLALINQVKSSPTNHQGFPITGIDGSFMPAVLPKLMANW